MEHEPYRKKQYSDEFKKQIVNELFASKENVSTFSRKIGIEKSIIHRWLKKYQKENKVDVPSEADESAELAMLRKEIAEIKESISFIRNILKKSFMNRYTNDFNEIALKSNKPDSRQRSQPGDNNTTR